MLRDAVPGQHIFGLLPDAHARHHIFAADGEGAQAIIDLLAHSRGELNGEIIVVYADTGPADAGFALRLCKQKVDRVLVMPTILASVGLLSVLVEAANISARIYAAGTDTLIGLVTQLAEARGLDPTSVIAEPRSTASAPTV
jgi:hypothetical protein